MGDILPVSVIIPHYNRADFIGNAIESIRRQTIQPAEIIVVDDASSPRHREALRQHESQARVVYLDKRHGSWGARNAGIAAATQPWLAFLDDDDQWLPDKLERQWNILRKDESLSAVTSAMTVVSDDRANSLLVSHSPRIISLAAAIEGTVAMIQTALIRADTIRSLDGFDARFRRFGDQEFWIRFTAAGYRAFYDRTPLAILNRKNMNRLSSAWWRRMFARLQVVVKHRSIYRRVHGPGAIRQEFSKRVRRAGLERGGIVGRIFYTCGCVLGGAWKSVVALAATGKMRDVPYTPATVPAASGDARYSRYKSAVR